MPRSRSVDPGQRYPLMKHYRKEKLRRTADSQLLMRAVCCASV
jgi:hypothetical protein